MTDLLTDIQDLPPMGMKSVRHGIWVSKERYDELVAAVAENARMVEEFAGFTYGQCPIGKHADYGFNHENSTKCPGCVVEYLTAERDRWMENSRIWSRKNGELHDAMAESRALVGAWAAYAEFLGNYIARSASY